MNKPNKPQRFVEPKKIMLFKFFREDGSFGFSTYEIDDDLFNQKANLIYKSNPDIFAVFMGQVQQALRGFFDI
jgi:hypothetical protein